MKIGVISLFPDMFQALHSGITGRALTQQLVTLKVINPRDYAKSRHQNVDDRPYGGGPGMVMLAEPLAQAIDEAKKIIDPAATVIYLSPQGKQFNQAAAQQWVVKKNLIFIAGRYEGIDERVINSLVDEEWSIGDYILSGGELAAMVMIDAMIRLLPGALGHEDSAQQDSFMAGLLDYPHYTRPEETLGQKVPAVLLSGDHKAIWRWRMQQALARTKMRRPDLLAAYDLDEQQQRLLADFIEEQHHE